MSSESCQGGLQRLFRCTESMLEAAEAGNWDAINMLETERNAELQTCFAASLEPAGSAAAGETISALIVLNNRLIESVAKERSRVLEHSQSLRQSRHASADYARLQSGH